jgi:hypothetical protein
MKKFLALYLYFLILFSQNSFTLNKKNLSNSNSKTSLRSTYRELLKQDSEIFMKQIFGQASNAKCEQEQMANQIGGFANKLRTGYDGDDSRNFGWIKNWGYGQSSFVFDFLDPVIGKKFIAEAKKIYKVTLGFNNSEYKGYKDPYLIDEVDPATGKLKKDVLPKGYRNKSPKEVFKSSVNAVQVKQCLENFRWKYNKYGKDPSRKFVGSYDKNGDSRLSPRELILGIIHTNRPKYNYGVCSMCFENLVPIIDSIFTYADCDQDGYITAENLIKYLARMKRETNLWDIFANIDIGIRTKSVNHFILQIAKTKNGTINKDEFRMGVLLGFWNRQTNDHKILDDDSQSLKGLRWADGGITDKELERYKYQLDIIKAQELAKSMDNQIVK